MRFALLATVLTVALAVTAALTSGAPVQVRAAQSNIDVGNFYFCDQSYQGSVCETTINAGDTIVWSVSAGFHTVTECDVNYSACPPTGGFGSGSLSQGQQFQQTFGSAGTFYYRCDFHAVMKGRVVVQAAQAPTTPTPTPSSSPTTAPTTAASTTATRTPAAVPATGGAPSSQAPAAGLAFVVAGILVAIAGAAAAYHARRR